MRGWVCGGFVLWLLYAVGVFVMVGMFVMYVSGCDDQPWGGGVDPQSKSTNYCALIPVPTARWFAV